VVEPRVVEVPEVIRRYFAAHDRGDVDVSLSTFARDGRVFDDGREYRGHGAIEDWLSRASTQFTYTRTFLNAVAEEADIWLVRNRLDGDFPGGVVELGYRFRLADGLIVDLVIQP
jgi:SnoaL-like protein